MATKAKVRKARARSPTRRNEGKGEGDAEGEGAGDGDDDSGDVDGSTGEGADGVAEEGELVEVAYQDFLPNSHEMKAPEDRTSFRGEKVTYTAGYRGSAYNPATKDQYFVVDFCRNQYTDERPSRGNAGSDHYKEMVNLVNGSGNGQAFSSQVRTRLQIRSKDKYEHGVKRGKLQQSLLHRVTVPNAPHLNEKVFKRRIVSDTLDTACIWLGDGSGSMGGTKYAQLIAASQKFNEAVGNVIGIPIEIHSFSTWQDTKGDEQPLMYVHRDFATRRLGSDELTRRMCIAGAHLANNPDGDAILWSFDRLRQSRAKRKLLIVASDGSPACCRGGDIDWYTREVVKKIEDETPIEIVGIGIMDDNVTRIYKEHYVIEDAAELEKALLALIDKKVR
jgi:cobalamin biosynthesis protein CobT